MEISHVSLKNYTSLRIGGKGNLTTVYSTKGLIEAVMFAKREGKEIYILGEGTNTFFGDMLETTLIIKNEIKGISFEESDDYVLVTASAGERWDDLVLFSVEKKLWGLENLSLIPGTVGAAPVQNIGAYGTELKDVFVSLSAFDTKTQSTVEISKEGCVFGYRDSLFKQEKNRYSIISVTFKLSKNAAPILTYKPLDTLLGKKELTPKDVRTLVVETRTAKLPPLTEYPNAGSFFKNPVISVMESEALRDKYPEIPCMPHENGFKIPAAWLIEHVAAMKGVREGGVGTWPNQPLVLVNYGEISADDLLRFSQKIIDRIYEKTGVTLEREVNYLL